MASVRLSEPRERTRTTKVTNRCFWWCLLKSAPDQRTYSTEITRSWRQPPASTHIKPYNYTRKLPNRQYLSNKFVSIIPNEFLMKFAREYSDIAQYGAEIKDFTLFLCLYRRKNIVPSGEKSKESEAFLLYFYKNACFQTGNSRTDSRSFRKTAGKMSGGIF